MEISFDRLRAAPRSRRILSTATQPPLLAWAGPLGLTASAFIRMATLSAAPTFSPDPEPCRHREVSREVPLLAPVVTVQLPRPMERPPAPAAQSLRVPAVPHGPATPRGKRAGSRRTYPAPAGRRRSLHAQSCIKRQQGRLRRVIRAMHAKSEPGGRADRA